MLYCPGTRVYWLRPTSTEKLKEAPYHLDYSTVPATFERSGHFPVTLDVRMQGDMLGKEKLQYLQPTLDEVNDYLNDIAVSIELPEINLPIHDAPNIYVGNKHANDSPIHHVADGSDTNKDRQMVIRNYDPSKAWKKEIARITTEGDVDFVLFITIGFSEYFLMKYLRAIGRMNFPSYVHSRRAFRKS